MLCSPNQIISLKSVILVAGHRQSRLKKLTIQKTINLWTAMTTCSEWKLRSHALTPPTVYGPISSKWLRIHYTSYNSVHSLFVHQTMPSDWMKREHLPFLTGLQEPAARRCSGSLSQHLSLLSARQLVEARPWRLNRWSVHWIQTTYPPWRGQCCRFHMLKFKMSYVMDALRNKHVPVRFIYVYCICEININHVIKHIVFWNKLCFSKWLNVLARMTHSKLSNVEIITCIAITRLFYALSNMSVYWKMICSQIHTSVCNSEYLMITRGGITLLMVTFINVCISSIPSVIQECVVK